MLVDTAWLAARLDDPRTVVVDMRWSEDGSARAAFVRAHIPGAIFLDWATDLVDPDEAIAFMLAPPGRFAAVLGERGIGDDAIVVAYADDLGSGPFRLWLGSRRYGHGEVHVLDGGFERWTAEGRPVTSEATAPEPASWTPRTGEDVLATADDVAAAERDPNTVVLDSRPPEQFLGEAVWFETGPVPAGPDGIARTPRGPLRAGRIPWARNVPVASVYRDDHTMKSPEELRAMFAAVGVERHTRVITYCGVAISATGLAYALRRAGIEDVAVYEAAWEEWGRDPSRPVATG
jgi:thiosulfate/3-mercaptopyruvate sulfurtransferase